MIVDEANELRSLKRGLQALSVINQRQAVSISELARTLELSRTTAWRIVTTLATEGYVHRLDADKRYRMSLKSRSLAPDVSDETWVTYAALPRAMGFTRCRGWPVQVYTADGLDMHVRLSTDQATSLWLTRRRIGSKVPMLGSGPGLCYLAFAPEAERQQILRIMKARDAELGRAAAPPVALPVGRIRADGFVFQADVNDREDGISLPILADGQLRGVLTMTFITRGLLRAEVVEEYLPELLRLADEIACEADLV